MSSVPLLVRDRFCPVGCEPLTIDPVTGIRRYYQDLGDDKVRIVEVQPVEDILRANAQDRYNAKGTMTQKGRWGYQAARVPTSMMFGWKYHADGTRLDPDEEAKVLRRNLNSSDYSKLRIGEATV